ncbi:MAG TPA: tetratricopeptide repeat protein [Planctomycetota bacterium]|nr:tetratricopeptide repeat protein [Planctomycetota bacterium]
MPRAACWGLAALILASGFAAFAPALRAGFVNWDDGRTLLENPSFRGLGPAHLQWMATTGRMGHYQPLSWLSLAVDHELWGLGAPPHPEAAGYHATSVALHALAAVAFFFVAFRLLATARARAGRRDPPARLALAAALASLVFALHPLRVESVAWVTERRDVLSGLFFVLALGAWLGWARPDTPRPDFTARRAALALALAAATIAAFFASVELAPGQALRLRGSGTAGLAGAMLAFGALVVISGGSARGAAPRTRYALAVVLALVSLLAKAWGIVLPALLLVLDAWPLARGGAAASRARAWTSLALEKAPLVVLSVVFGALAAWAQRFEAGTMASLASHTPAERAAQALYGLAWYPARTLAPGGFSVHHGMPAELSLAQPRFALPALAVLAAAALLVALRRRAPALLAAALAYAVIVSPVLGLVQSGPQLVAERYSYLSCLPFALLAGGAYLAWASRGAMQQGAALAVGAGIAALLGVLTFRQARVWQSSSALWEQALAAEPASSFAAQKLAETRMDAARDAREPERRLELAREASRLLEQASQPGDPMWLTNASLCERLLAELDVARRPEHLARALELSSRAIARGGELGAILPEYRLAHANNLLSAGQPADAARELERFVAERPDSALGFTNLGIALALQGRHADALGSLRRAVELDPSYGKGWMHLAQTLDAAGDRTAARAAWSRVAALWPAYGPALERLRDP